MTDNDLKSGPQATSKTPTELLENCGGSEGLGGPDGLLKQLTASLVSRALDGELEHHLGYTKGEKVPEQQQKRHCDGFDDKISCLEAALPPTKRQTNLGAALPAIRYRPRPIRHLLRGQARPVTNLHRQRMTQKI